MSMIADRASDVLVVDQIGRTRSVTPEGYLYCEGVRIARTGPMLYRPDEIPEVAPDKGMVTMLRDEDVLFSEETIASFQGKDVTNSHPENLLTADTWQGETVGVVLNPRRGEGVEASFLLADLLIKDAAAIAAVQSGLREVSCGYDGDREQVQPGVGRFTRIIGNHVALVDRGRCGPACAIGDQETTTMKKRTVWDRLRTAFKANDEAAFNEELQKAMQDDESSEEGGKAVTVHIHNGPGAKPDGEAAKDDEGEAAPEDPIAKLTTAVEAIASGMTALTERVAKIEAGERGEAAPTGDEEGEGEEKKDEEEDKGGKGAMDAAGLKSDFQDVVAKAEILSPGVKLPVFDSKAPRKTVADQMCGLRVEALKRAFGDEKRKEFVEKIVGPKPAFDAMPCDQVVVVFNAAAELARIANASKDHSFEHNVRQGPMTAEKMQERIEAMRKNGAK